MTTFPDPLIIGTYYSDATGGYRWSGSAWISATGPDPRRHMHTFALGGAVTPSITVPGFFVAIASGETLKIIYVRYRIRSGTSQAFYLQKNAGTLAGFGTSGSPLSATTTATTTDPTDVTLAADDEITLVLGTGSGTPADLSVTLVMESTTV